MCCTHGCGARSGTSILCGNRSLAGVVSLQCEHRSRRPCAGRALPHAARLQHRLHGKLAGEMPSWM
eukprot:6191537-Pleurochrysis_carterae.AAC.1